MGKKTLPFLLCGRNSKKGSVAFYPLYDSMKKSIKNALLWSVVALAIGFITPPSIIFLVEVFVGAIDPVTSLAGIWRRQFAEGGFPLLLPAINLIPFVILSIVIFVAARSQTPLQLACLALGGLVGILALMVPMHVSIWYSLHGPGNVLPIAVVELLFIPFYCIVSLILGLIAGGGVSQIRYF